MTVDEKLLSIGQLATAAGVSSRTIRYYEELGILPAPPRSSAGTRKYPPEWRFYLEGALALKEIGFSLDEVRLFARLALGRKMSKTERKQATAAVSEKMAALEQQMEVLRRLARLLGDFDKGNEAPAGGLNSVLDLTTSS